VSFPFNVYLPTLASAFLVAWLSLPLWRRWALRIGLVDDPGHRKIHHTPVPLAGGWAVLTGFLVPLALGALALKLGLLGADSANPLSHGFGRRLVPLIVVAAGALGMLLLGWLDDRHELQPAQKFAGQFLIASGVALAGVRITLFVPNLLFSYAVTVLWILTLVNAFNFTDNMNGLCAGLGAIAAWYFALLAGREGQYLVALLGLATCGALAGFLPWNYPQARAFLGDAGSHLVGYLVAVLAILPHFFTMENPHVLAVLSPLLILAVPLMDLVQVVIGRWRRGQPFYVGDTNHLSHLLARSGLSRTQAVGLLWAIAAVLGAIPFFW
jgi:UDP-GlcNAc:undecaprenyl-phosphate GlcNAc-1-phosphate transferase